MKNTDGIANLAVIKLFICCSLFVCLNRNAAAQLSADFSVSSAQGCSPFTVQFHDLSTGSPTSWFWDFGNKTTSDQQNPTVVYTDSGKYDVRLIVRNASGEDYVEKQNYVTVFQSVLPQFSSAVDSGCAPLKVAFINMTSLSNSRVQSWLWNFGDGSSDSAQNPTHIFQTKGFYPVSLTAKSANGCISILTVPGAVRAGNHTKPNFTVSPVSGCASALRYFTNTSSGDLSFSHWSFGDGEASNEKDPVYHYQDTGWFSVKLVAGDNGCKDSTVIRNLLHVNGPVALLNAVINCDDRFTVRFADLSIGGKTRKWNFGDGNFSVSRTDTHVYSSPGVYTARLKVDNDICSDTALYVINISTKKPSVKLVPQKDFYCKNDSILFVFTNYDTAFARSFGWNFGDDSITELRPKFDSVTHVYLNNGFYKVTGYLEDNERCIDIVALDSPIVITGPTAGFNFTKPGCKEMPINFKDSSTSNKGAALMKWVWDFDDGTIQNATETVYTYSFPLVYNVKLLVKDANGCTDSIYHEVQVSEIPTVQVGPDNLLCAGQSATLHARGASNYVWTNANELSCRNCSDPIVTPFKTSTYHVTGSNEAGCSSEDSVLINVQEKEDVKVYTSLASLCAGDSVQLQAQGADIYSWTPDASLNNATIANPMAYPAVNTTYIVTGKDRNACFSDTAMLDVIVHPKPFVNIADSIVQVLSGSTYQIQATASEDVRYWKWLPVNDISCFTCPQPVATVKNSIKYTVTVSNGFGCSNEDAINLVSLCSDQVLYVPNTFSPNGDGRNDYFFPRSNKDVFIKSFKIFNRWGQAVFEKMNFPSNNYAYGWNGKFKNADQQSDVYVYLMEVECANGNAVIKKGDVSLVR